MTFTVQEGEDGIADANAAAALAFVDAYHDDRGNTSWTGTTTEKQQAIIRATDYLERVWAPFLLGLLADTDIERNVSFPRIGLYDRNGVYQTETPSKWQQACAEYALRALLLAGDGLFPDPTDDDALIRERKKVGPIETEREWSAFGDESTIPSYPLADALIQEFLGAAPGAGRSHRA